MRRRWLTRGKHRLSRVSRIGRLSQRGYLGATPNGFEQALNGVAAPGDTSWGTLDKTATLAGGFRKPLHLVKSEDQPLCGKRHQHNGIELCADILLRTCNSEHAAQRHELCSVDFSHYLEGG